MRIALSVLVTSTLLGAGVYITAVLDRLAGARVAGRRPLLATELIEPAARAAALLVQRRTTTERPDDAAWALAPALLMAAAAVALASVPLGPDLAAAPVADGLVLYGAAISMVLVAVFLHGWSPNSPFPLLGAYRFAAQGLSFPIPFILTLISAGLAAESLAVGDIVRSQHGLWNLVRQPLGLPVFLVTGWGLAFWGPLALPDAADLAGGTTAEASGGAALAWRVGQHAVLVAVAAMGAAAFLGGWHGPLLPGPVWTILKTVAVLAVLVAGGHQVARVRIERFVLLAWVVLIPLALVDVFASGALAL